MSEEAVERIARIVDGLGPIGGATPGSPVRAADWNTLVGAVLELARVGLDRERTLSQALAANYAAAGHDHVGVADLRWFEPDTRELIETGGAGRPDLEADLKQHGQQVAALGDRVEGLSEMVEKLRQRIDEVLDRDAAHRRAIDDLAARIETLAEQEERLTDLRRSFQRIDGRVGKALDLGGQLEGAGDLTELRRRVDDLSSLRRNLVGADGTTVSLRDVERRIVSLEAGAPRTPSGETFDPDELRTTILAAAAAEVEARTKPLGQGLGELRAAVDGVSGALTGATQAVEDVRKQAATHAEQIKSVQDLSRKVAGLQVRTTNLTARSRIHDAGIESLEPLADRMVAVEAGLGDMQPVVARVAQVESGVAAATQALGELPTIRQQVQELGRLSATVGTLNTRVNSAISLAQQARAGITAHSGRLSAVEALADDAAKSVTRLRTDTNATRETLSILSGDVAKLRTATGTTTSTTTATSSTLSGTFTRFPVTP